MKEHRRASSTGELDTDLSASRIQKLNLNLCFFFELFCVLWSFLDHLLLAVCKFPVLFWNRMFHTSLFESLNNLIEDHLWLPVSHERCDFLVTRLIWLKTELQLLDILSTLLIFIGSCSVEIDIAVEFFVLIDKLSLLLFLCLFYSCFLLSL